MTRLRRPPRASGPSGPAAASRRPLLLAIGLAAITIAVYASVRGFAFVSLDDHAYVVENPHVLPGVTWAGIVWAFTSGYSANWHPLTWMSHMLDVQLFGLNAPAHHAMNVVLHAVTTLLLFVALHRMTGALWRSAVVAQRSGVEGFLRLKNHLTAMRWSSNRRLQQPTPSPPECRSPAPARRTRHR